MLSQLLGPLRLNLVPLTNCLRLIQTDLNSIKLLGTVRRVVHIEEHATPFSTFLVSSVNSWRTANEGYKKIHIIHNVYVFEPEQVELAKKVEVGDRIFVEGRLSYGKKEGYTIRKTSVVAEKFVPLEPVFKEEAAGEESTN